MSEIWFIRHAESAANAGAVSADTETVPLSARGHAQARALALTFPRTPDVIISSPFLRAVQSAQPLRERYPDAPFETWPVQEFTFLAAERYKNSSTEQRRPHSEAYWQKADPAFHDGPGAESFEALAARLRNDIFQPLQAAPPGFRAVFTHERIVEFIHLFLSRPELSLREMMQGRDEFRKKLHIPNCFVLKVEANSEGLRLL